MGNMKSYLEEYNKYIERYNNANKYLDDNSVDITNREKWLCKYQEIIVKLQSILDLMDFYGIKYTANEIENGFDVKMRMGEAA